MSLDIASHPGRTGTDELVPSRYALRVGEIDVLVISDGVLTAAARTLPNGRVATSSEQRIRFMEPSLRWRMQDHAFGGERRSHSSRPMRPRRASPKGTSERSSTRLP